MTPEQGNHSTVDSAARWLAAEIDHMPNVIGILRQRFGLSAVQAAQACTLANKYRIEAHQLRAGASYDCHVTSQMSRYVTRDGNALRNVTSVTNSAESLEFHGSFSGAAPIALSDREGAA
ncbi:hypothetical protein [Rhizobium leguminosarum]|uniref:hypothetical protein n=1 Tax=Rhizobium leguminosarum TaxID=384 RepID=UPI003F9DEBD5